MKTYYLKMSLVGIALFLLTICLVLALQKGLYLSSIPLILLIILSFMMLFYINQQIIKTLENILAAIAKKDFSKNFNDTHLSTDLVSSLQSIKYNQLNNQGENTSQKHIFGQIIDSLDTGILILKEIEGKREIYYINQAFSELLEIPKFTKWHLAQKHLRELDHFVDTQHWRDHRDVITLSINGKEQIFSLGTFITRLYDHRYLILQLDTLQSIIDRKEKEAWYNLMKVMSHEILNTITPINSLSNNLEYLISERKTELGEDFDDIHTSVLTISNRTQHLADFVDTYRQLSELPSPQREQVKIKPILEASVQVMSSIIKERGIQVSIEVKPENAYFNIDKKQIEQAIINLITNSVYALEKTTQPYIHIRSYQTSNKQCIEIIDNGIGIAQEIKREVFVPFFTTREHGAGIGLSLAKNIVQAHNGLIGFTSGKQQTTFLLQFEY